MKRSVPASVLGLTIVILCGSPTASPAAETIRNDLYTLTPQPDGATIEVAGLPPIKWLAEFTVLYSAADPHCTRYTSHPNYGVAPRVAVRWRRDDQPLDELNAWLASPEMTSATGLKGIVTDDAKAGRTWEFRDAKDKATIRVTGAYARDTTRPLTVGTRAVVRAEKCELVDRTIRWSIASPPDAAFRLAAELALPWGDADPQLTYMLTPTRAGYFSVAYSGAPSIAFDTAQPVPQECHWRGHKLFNFVMSEADLHMPRVHVADGRMNITLAIDPRECRFRLPKMEDSRFGCMISRESDQLKPMIFAPLLGGFESQMKPDAAWNFTLRLINRAGDWKQTYSHLARTVFDVRDDRDNSGPGSLNSALQHTLDFLANRNGKNYAMWDDEQKYFDYFTDKTGVYKPFSVLYGLSAAIVCDDADLFYKRAMPAVEYALSRKTSVFAPYDTVDNKQARSFGRAVGAPYLNYTQLVTLHELFERRNPVIRHYADQLGPTSGKIGDALSRWRLTGDTSTLDEAKSAAEKLLKSDAAFSEDAFFEVLDLANATRDPAHIRLATEAAYHNAAKLNVYPTPPDGNITMDAGGKTPIHFHSFGRHKNVWGYPSPQSIEATERSVPAWRISRVGTPSIAYPIEYWMNTHGAMMRTAGLAKDPLLRDLARGGMVGRFGTYPGDNRSQNSLIAESHTAVEAPPWKWNYATVNPGHAWDFAGQLLDFLVSDCFERSQGKIDFPALSAASTNFRVQIFGGKPGKFYDDEGVRLWIPSDLVACDNRQFDWLAGHGNGKFYLALWNQSASEQQATIEIAAQRVEIAAQDKGIQWLNGSKSAMSPLRDSATAKQSWKVTLPGKGIVAYAIPAQVNRGIQAELYDQAPPLGPRSFTNVDTAFGKVHAMLLRSGGRRSSLFVYTDATPENVIGAQLRCYQDANRPIQSVDSIYPYEFAIALKNQSNDVVVVMDIETTDGKILSSPPLSLSFGVDEINKAKLPDGRQPNFISSPLVPFSAPPAGGKHLGITDEFFEYLKKAANGGELGLRANGRFYPYSTPQGRRIGWRQEVWHKSLYSEGCTREEADSRFRGQIHWVINRLRDSLDYEKLDQRQRETLIDFAISEGVDKISATLQAAIKSRDWDEVVGECLYVRYAGHAPDHARNKAFAERWKIK